MVNSTQYLTCKRNALEKYFSKLNPEQRKAVFTVKGPVLILAGAGSGKTSVLINRIANMIFFGDAYEADGGSSEISQQDLDFLESYAAGIETDSNRLREITASNCIKPWNILAITFTNKAAGELRDRLQAMLGEESGGITAATFHSACVRILRREIDHLGYQSSFTIYDSDDSQRIVKTCLSELNVPEKQFPPKTILSIISGAKDEMITPEDFLANAEGDFRKQVVGRVYRAYQDRLRTANAIDFDDIIGLTVELFEKFPDVLEHYQNRYKYIMVDEYQDTNQAQYRLVSLLSAKHKNLCVVGDDDQSIYRFRGATIENILSFEAQFTGCTTIRLEQNYRSTQNILSAANNVIKNNRERKEKRLWTDQGDGQKIIVYKAADETGESRHVADVILENVQKGMRYGDHAVLYRMNAQSNSLERALTANAIPYKIVGGLRFYDRKEIRDVVAYLSVINNPADFLRLRRIINEPKRGIGDATVLDLEEMSMDLKMGPLEVMRNASSYPQLAKKAAALTNVANMFDRLAEAAETEPLDVFLEHVLEETGYLAFLKSQGEEGKTRLENVEELKSTITNYMQAAEEPSLAGFLEEIALYTDVDKLEQNSDAVVLMTMHSAKGLEFPAVFIVGMEEGIFPGVRSMNSDADMEEERRLAYVAITRAREQLTIMHASQRMLFGQTNRNLISRFIKEIGSDLIEHVDSTVNITRGVKEAPVLPRKAMTLQQQLAGRKAAVSKAEPVDFAPGDQVMHNIFGTGMILSVKKMAGDAMLEVAFETHGTKKIMANFAKIKKIQK